MNPTIAIVMWVVAVITTHGLPLLTWWLHLRGTMQHENTRRRYLIAIADALPEGGQISEECSDGTWMRLGIDRGRRSKSKRGERGVQQPPSSTRLSDPGQKGHDTASQQCSSARALIVRVDR
jgi:hypothetical protein